MSDNQKISSNISESESVAATWLHFRCYYSPSPIPRIAPKVAPKRATKTLPRHGLTAEYFSWSKPKETTKTDSPTTSKWQIGLFLWQNPHRGGCGLPQGERSVPLSRSRGAAPGESLVTFFSQESHPGAGRSACISGDAGTLVPAKASGAEAPKRNGVHKFPVVPLPPRVL